MSCPVWICNGHEIDCVCLLDFLLTRMGYRQADRQIDRQTGRWDDDLTGRQKPDLQRLCFACFALLASIGRAAQKTVRQTSSQGSSRQYVTYAGNPIYKGFDLLALLCLLRSVKRPRRQTDGQAGRQAEGFFVILNDFEWTLY